MVQMGKQRDVDDDDEELLPIPISMANQIIGGMFTFRM